MSGFSASFQIPGTYGEWPGAYFGILPSSTDAVNSAGFATALAAIDAAGGGVLRLSPGTYSISAPIDNYYSQVTVSGPDNGRSTFHDIGEPRYPVIIQPTFAGTALKHRTPYNGPTQSIHAGGGFTFLTVNGNGVATRLLEVDSVRNGSYFLFLLECVGTEAALFTCGVGGTDIGEAADVQGARIELYLRQFSPGAARSCKGVVCTGSTNGNFSFNHDVIISGQMYDGDLLDLVSADNNDFTLVRSIIAGTGRGLVCRGGTAAHSGVGAGSNRFRRVTGGATYAEGTGTGGVINAVQNSIESLDTGNGTPMPTAGTGSGWRVEVTTELNTTTGAILESPKLTGTGTRSGNASLDTIIAPTNSLAANSSAQFNVSGQTPLVIANGANSAVGSSALDGVWFVAETANTFDIGIYFVFGGYMTLSSSMNGVWVAPTTTPAAGKFSIGLDGAYKIYNNSGASGSFKAAFLRLT